MQLLACTCIGFLMVDIVIHGLQKIPDPGEITYVGRDFTISTGGHAINVPIDLVKLGLDPKTIMVVGAVGSDPFGSYVLNVISKYGFVSNVFVSRATGTGKNVILVEEGQDRRFIIATGANEDLPANFVRRVLAGAESYVTYLAIGFLGEVDSAAVDIASDVRSKSIVFLDFVIPPSKASKKREEIFRAACSVHILHCNVGELKYLTNAESIEDGAKRLIDEGTSIVLVTLGSRGAFLLTKDLTIFQPAFRVDAIDSTGAGDAFSAGIIYWLIKHEIRDPHNIGSLDEGDLVEMLMFAQATGASATTGAGAATAVSIGNVMSLIREQGERISEMTSVKKR